jgi:hypothetical protein
MSALTVATALALATACQSVVAPATIVGIAQQESGLEPSRVHHNRDGSIDVGLMQINSRNWAWLGLDERTALDPCRSIAAGAAVLMHFSQYNSGSPTRSLRYALAVAHQTEAVSAKTEMNGPTAPSSDASANDPSDPRPPAWDMEARAAWRERHDPTAEDARASQIDPDITETKQ